MSTGISHHNIEDNIFSLIEDKLRWEEYTFQLLPLVEGKFQNNVVLEIAPGECAYSNIYKNAGMKKYIAVEPNAEWLRVTQRKMEELNSAESFEFVHSTYEDYQLNQRVDTVYCSGLLYHLASPIHCLEKIVNMNPDNIILETTGHAFDASTGPVMKNGMITTEHAGGFSLENINSHGMRFTDPLEKNELIGITKKAVGLNMYMSCDFIIWCLDHMGYRMDDYVNFNISDAGSKTHSSAMSFVKKDQ
jgi:hypothetical protein